MPDITEQQPTGHASTRDNSGSTWRRLVWFAGLYCAGLGMTYIVVWFFRMLLGLS